MWPCVHCIVNHDIYFMNFGYSSVGLQGQIVLLVSDLPTKLESSFSTKI